ERAVGQGQHRVVRDRAALRGGIAGQGAVGDGEDGRDIFDRPPGVGEAVADGDARDGYHPRGQDLEDAVEPASVDDRARRPAARDGQVVGDVQVPGGCLVL